MNEDFLHFIFQYKLWTNHNLMLTNGQNFEIIDIGRHNFDSGPDFFNAKIKIDDTIWAGNIEIHIKSSDWYKHHHQQDTSYNNVILHIVFSDDKDVCYPNGEKIPTWEISFDHSLFNSYSKIKNELEQINCTKYLDIVEKEKIDWYIQNLSVERLEYKVSEIKNILEKTKNDWEETFYIMLARSFGFNINSLPFELLAMQTPLSLVKKNADDLLKLEALMLGQAGMLQKPSDDNNLKNLLKEYQYLQQKFALTPMNVSIWKKSKTRPANQPINRIKQFAEVLTHFQELFTAITNENKISSIKKYFTFGTSSYEIIAINTIAPFLYVYFSFFAPEKSENIYYKCLSNIKAENNTEIRKLKQAGFNPKNAYETQSLLHLKKNYCDKKRCLNCKIGYEILNQINKL